MTWSRGTQDTVLAVLRRAVDTDADATLLDIVGEKTSYGELFERAMRLANGLRAHGVEPGDRVVTLLDSNVDAVAAWFAYLYFRRRRDLMGNRWFLRAAALCGPAAVVALEAGWVTTEVGRQPWTVYGILRTHDAVNTAPGLRVGLVVILIVYTLLTVATVYVLRRLARDKPVPTAPQEADVETFPVP